MSYDMSFFVPYQSSSADMIDTDSIAFLYNNLQNVKASYTEATVLSDALALNSSLPDTEPSMFSNVGSGVSELSQGAAYYNAADNSGVHINLTMSDDNSVSRIGVMPEAQVSQPNIQFTNLLKDQRADNDSSVLTALELGAIQNVLGYDPLAGSPTDINAIQAIDIMSDHLMHAFVDAVESNFDQLFLGSGMFRVSMGISGLTTGGSSLYLGEDEQEEEQRRESEDPSNV